MTEKKNQEIESEDFPELFELIEQLPDESKIYTSHILNIPRYVKFMLKSMQKSQNYISERTGKPDSEISKWLSGKQNMTLRTISKLEAALGIDIINPKIKSLIADLKKNNIIDSPLTTFPAGISLNVFIMPGIKGEKMQNEGIEFLTTTPSAVSNITNIESYCLY